MPLTAKKISKNRISFEESLSQKEIQQLIADKDLKTLQCSAPVKPQTWELLNNQFFPIRPEVELRVYGFYSLVCDLGFASKMTNVRHFSADCLRDVAGIEHITAMEKLESLGIGIYHLHDFEFLKQISLENMKGLQDISALEHAPALEEFIHFAAGNMQPEDYLALLRNPHLKRVSVGFGSEKRNNRFKALILEYNIQSFVPGVFEFV